MYLEYFYFLIFSTLAFFSCKTEGKTEQEKQRFSYASISKTFDNKKCSLVAVSNSTYANRALGELSPVYYIPSRFYGNAFISYIVVNDTTTIVLENELQQPFLDSMDLLDYLQSITLTFNPQDKQVWIKRTHPKLNPVTRSTINHYMNDTFHFYTQQATPPKWDTVLSPQAAFEKLFSDSSITKEESKLLYSYLYTLPTTNELVYKSIPYWTKSKEARFFIGEKNFHDINHTTRWVNEMKKLIKERVRIIEASDSISAYLDEMPHLNKLVYRLQNMHLVSILDRIYQKHALLNDTMLHHYYQFYGHAELGLQAAYETKGGVPEEFKESKEAIALRKLRIKSLRSLLPKVKAAKHTKNYVHHASALYQMNIEIRDTAVGEYCICVLADSCMVQEKYFNQLSSFARGIPINERKLIRHKVSQHEYGKNGDKVKELLRWLRY